MHAMPRAKYLISFIVSLVRISTNANQHLDIFSNSHNEPLGFLHRTLPRIVFTYIVRACIRKITIVVVFFFPVRLHPASCQCHLLLRRCLHLHFHAKLLHLQRLSDYKQPDCNDRVIKKSRRWFILT